MRLSEDRFRAIWQSAAHDRAIGHEHFWERALSRRQFLGTAGAASGVAGPASPRGARLGGAAAARAGPPQARTGAVFPAAPIPIEPPRACAHGSATARVRR